MKKWVKFLISIVLLSVIYFGFLLIVDRKQSTGNAPTFQVPASILTASVHDDETKIIEGIKVTDQEDGDLSSQIFVESMSGFDENNCRTVNFGVFDSDDNLTRATRTIQYTDYEKPVITLKKALCYVDMHMLDRFKEFVEAKSVVDGDLTGKINIEREYTQGENEYIVFSVTDSCGTKSTLTAKADKLKEETSIKINLSEYLIRVAVGTKIDPLNYIESISGNGMTERALRNQLHITNDYNSSKKGMYEYNYRIDMANGDYGYTKLVVIVE